MKWIYSLNTNCQIESVADLGGKGASLARLAKDSFNLPVSACVVSSAYREFIKVSGIQEKIFLELNRKNFSDMRWEEIWDASLRIRNYFLHAAIPDEIQAQITSFIETHFQGKFLAVRSSAPDEDTGHTSFAGLHESYLNIRGSQQVLEHIKKVWASLWSDRALLYRQELGLDVISSAMAVVVQEMIIGESSGIVFSQHPEKASQMIIESVYGLNQSLVDGAIEPDRWILNKEDGTIVTYTPPTSRRQALYNEKKGFHHKEISGLKASKPPLSQDKLNRIRELALQLEVFFGCPQDIEWTIQAENLFVLQSRPVTAITEGGEKDERAWYLSLHRSFDNLCTLWHEIEKIHLPAMDAEAKQLTDIALEKLSDAELATEIEKRIGINDKWVKVYWSECIPFAHGIRLFGEVYNDVVKPDDPFEFVSLLSGSSMLSTERNALLAELASMLSSYPLKIRKKLGQGDLEGIEDPVFLKKLQNVQQKFGNLFSENSSPEAPNQTERIFLSLIYEYTKKPFTKSSPVKTQDLEEYFLSRISALQLPFSGAEVLELGRASYRLRDDDNIYLGRVEKQLNHAISEGRIRLQNQNLGHVDSDDMFTIVKLLRGEVISPGALRKQKKDIKQPFRKSQITARQLIGQPASKGIARGPCRLIESAQDLAEFKQGEILVVDAIDPNMTFIAPLASAIVERRGGMLIHGAIIAREYGIPCVTGIPEAMQLIQNGKTITVDGYLGIVTLGESSFDVSSR